LRFEAFGFRADRDVDREREVTDAAREAEREVRGRLLTDLEVLAARRLAPAFLAKERRRLCDVFRFRPRFGAFGVRARRTLRRRRLALRLLILRWVGVFARRALFALLDG